METVASGWLWAAFSVVIMGMLAIDLMTLRGPRAVTTSLAVRWTLVWVSAAFLFAGGLWAYLAGSMGHDHATRYVTLFLTAYLTEKSLAVDNLFVFLLVFTQFAIPSDLQRRILVYGVLGAILLRGIIILFGAWLIGEVHWILYLFGAFLVFTGIKMWFVAEDDDEKDMQQNPAVRWLRKHLRLTEHLDGAKFWVRRDGLLYATPLLLVLVLIEGADIIFAADSLPAVFAITTDPFIVLTSNIFAILGLRAMYFLLADMADRFAYLQQGLSVVLVFIGTKMLIEPWLSIPTWASLLAVSGVLAASVWWSLLRTRAAT